jgi:hypothetical protein
MAQVDTDILYPALRLAGVLTGSGRGATEEQRDDAFQSLNQMLDSWNNQRLTIYSTRIDRYTLTPSKTSYTIGPDPGVGFTAPDFIAPRPHRIVNANIVTTTGGSEVHLKVQILTDQQWASKVLREVPTTIPTEVYNDGAFPVSRLYLWGYPTAGNDLELFSWSLLTQYAAQDDKVYLPPAYLSAVVYNLAVRLCGLFGTLLRPDVDREAIRLRGIIKAGNAPAPQIPSADYGMRGRGGSSFNYLSGGPK